MKKLANKLSKIDIDLPKWTREILFEHITDVCKGFKNRDGNNKENTLIYT